MNTVRKFKIKPLRNITKQQGWTFWGLLFVSSVVLFFAYIGMQLVPVYSGNQNVKNAMERSIQDQDLRRINRNKIVKAMKAQLYLDGTSKLLDYKTDLTISRSPREFVLETNYERELPLFFNLSLVASFDNRIERELSGE